MSKIGWVKKELEETENEVNVLCNRYFINCENHWTEDREFVLELKGLVSKEAYPFLVDSVNESWREFIDDQAIDFYA
tara:strand:- start:517 stop:747 length:231 start_codon:yes stop_codon:yes gene_type:complete